MIEEIKIMSKFGTNIFSGNINLDKAEISMGDQDVLFAGFISAILSVSEELQSENIKELGYQDNKLIFIMSENLIFLGVASRKVPNEDVEALLNTVKNKWMDHYEDADQPHIPNEMRENIVKIIEEALGEVFWWANPDYNLENNMRLLKSVYTKPGSSYFIQYLPRIYVLTSFLMLLIPILGSFALRSTFTGFGLGGVPSRSSALIGTLFTLSVFWIGIPAIMELMNRDNFDFTSYVILSGLYSVLLLIALFFTSPIWLSVYNDINSLVGGNIFLGYLVQMVLFFGPFNIGFFSYIILIAFSSSYTNNLNTSKYMVYFLFAVLIGISITEFVVRGIWDISP